MLTRRSDHPDRSLGLGHDPTPAPDINLRAVVDVVVCSPHPHALHRVAAVNEDKGARDGVRTSRYAVDEVVRCRPMNAAKHALLDWSVVGHSLACRFVPASGGRHKVVHEQDTR